MAEQLVNLALILTVTTAVVMLLRLFKQPPIISYILAGILLGPSLLGITSQTPNLEALGQLGITLLLFIVGLNLDIKSLKRVGLISVFTGVGQVLFTSVIGFGIARILGFSAISSLYIATALTFSSTIIIVKLLTDRRDLESLHGKIAMGFLVVQDIIAVIALMFISTLSGAQQTLSSTLLTTVIGGAIIFLGAYLVSQYILPYILKQAGKNQEVIFLFSITWCFAVAAIFYLANFSLEIGALIAGLMLASTPYSYEIASKIKPLRDFFITIFFIVLGSHLEIGSIGLLILPAIIFSLFILIGNPLIVMGLMGLKGFSKRTSFMAGLAVAQISEFSLILVTLGVAVGHVSTEVLNLTTLVGLVTILGSTYFFVYADQIYNSIGKRIPYYRKGMHRSENRKHADKKWNVILFGYNRMGESILEHFHKNDHDYIIVDFNPETVLELQEQGRNAILGDANDIELYEELRIGSVHTVVSTITDQQASKLLLNTIRKDSDKTTVIVTAAQPDEAIELYDLGADYVVIPHLVGGDHATVMLDVAADDVDAFIDKKVQHLKQLKSRHT
jgi:Kef-type K+ transport system membrane component KefB